MYEVTQSSTCIKSLMNVCVMSLQYSQLTKFKCVAVTLTSSLKSSNCKAVIQFSVNRRSCSMSKKIVPRSVLKCAHFSETIHHPPSPFQLFNAK